MGREVKRVALGFAWPIGKIWWGYLLPRLPCQLCQGTGKRPFEAVSIWGHESVYCESCEGEGMVHPKVEVPEWKPWEWEKEPPQGLGWQMWENTTEGSPISPVFATPEELARWLADSNASSMGSRGATYEQWLKMILKGWAPSMVVDSGGLRSGVEFVSEEKE